MKTAILIDGSNLHAAAKHLQFRIDYKKLRKWFDNFEDVIRVNWYTAIITQEATEEHEQGYVPIQKLVDWLSYNGYRVIKKEGKQFEAPDGKIYRKGNVDIEIAIDAVQLIDRVDHVVLCTGDGDFEALVDTLQRAGLFVTILSTIKTKPALCADNLRKVGDEFIELADIKQDD